MQGDQAGGVIAADDLQPCRVRLASRGHHPVGYPGPPRPGAAVRAAHQPGAVRVQKAARPQRATGSGGDRQR